jgi:hypothetical protein
MSLATLVYVPRYVGGERRDAFRLVEVVSDRLAVRVFEATWVDDAGPASVGTVRRFERDEVRSTFKGRSVEIRKARAVYWRAVPVSGPALTFDNRASALRYLRERCKVSP